MGMIQKQFADLFSFTRASAGGRFNAQGVYEMVPANTPRIDYDPVTKACRGLLVEEQRTRLNNYAINLNSLGGNTANCVITEHVILSPDGQMNGCLADSTTTTSNRAFTVSATAGSTYSFSAYVKRGNQPIAAFEFNGAATLQCKFNFDTLATQYCKATHVGGGWYRLEATITATTTAALNGFIYGNSGYSQPIGTCYWFGLQLEAGAFPTSLILGSEGSQVTRAADVCSINTLSPWWNQVEGALFVEFLTTKSAIDASTRAVVSGNDSATRFISCTNLTSQINIRDNNNGPSVDVGMPAISSIIKAASSYSSNGLGISANGSVVQSATDAPVTIPSTTRVSVGNFGNANSFLCGHIRKLRYYPKRLDNATLQALTA